MLEIRSGQAQAVETELLVIADAEDGILYEDAAIGELVNRARRYNEFQGRKKDELLLYQPEGVKAVRLLFVGVGRIAEAGAESFRKAAGKAVKTARRMELEEIAIALPAAGRLNFSIEQAAAAFFEGAALANHVFDHYKKEKKEQPLRSILLYTEPETAQACAKVPARVETICRSTILAREWVNMPPNEKRPDRFVRSVTKAADKEALSAVVLDEPQLKKNRMGGILAVGAGSRSRPRMVILDYRPPKADQTYALVGKGVTFDSGGINLKAGGSLEDMKSDMAGAAAVAAALVAVARLKPGYRVVGIMPVVENMPSGDAVRPGDIIRSSSGKTIEIANTDAEGRLILADALAYAERQFKPDVMIDAATLTGACIMALGERIAGVFARDAHLAEAIVSAGSTVHERCWSMPMPEDYRELLKSDFADIRNIGSSRWGGAIAAALFLSEFVETERWAHIDIAGPAYARKASDYCGPGGTGFGARLLIEAMRRLDAAAG